MAEGNSAAHAADLKARSTAALAALHREAGTVMRPALAASAPASPSGAGVRVSAPALRAGDVHVGSLDSGGELGLDLRKLLEGRLLIQGTSGAGKSWTLRRLLELSAHRVQQILIDPEGEFRAFAEAFDHVLVEAHRLDAAAIAVAARRAREHRLSMTIDLSELDREAQLVASAAVFAALVEAPREHWHPCLVAIDEAHLFAPFGGQVTSATSIRRAAIGTLTDLMSRGRKRGLSGVLATQRLARLAKSVVSEAHNFMVGLNTLDIDIRRAAETIGWDARRAFDSLPGLEPGSFVASGPAFSKAPSVVKVGPVETRHTGAAPALSAPADLVPADALRLIDLDELIAESAADIAARSEVSLGTTLKARRGLIRDPACADAARAYAALSPLRPEGAKIGDLSRHLAIETVAIAAALALLDSMAMVEFSGTGEDRAVRLVREP
jgi:hypothetical protein